MVHKLTEHTSYNYKSNSEKTLIILQKNFQKLFSHLKKTAKTS